MADQRISQFTKFYHEEYQKKLGIPYHWKGGKEQKLMEKCFKYFESIFEDAIKEMKEAAMKYLQSEDKFYKDAAFDLSLFLSKPERWLKRSEKRDRPLPPPVHEVIPKSSQGVVYASIEAFKNKAEPWIAENPIRALKAFLTTGPILKKMDLEKYTWMREYLIELVGKKRAIEVYNQEKTLQGSLGKL